MQRSILRTILALCTLSFISGAALAQDASEGGGTLLFNDARNCGPTQQVAMRLLTKYDEIQVATLNMNENSFLALYTNHLKETWTLVEVRADGLTCIRAWGNGQHLALGEPT